jgi:hypothetical protein
MKTTTHDAIRALVQQRIEVLGQRKHPTDGEREEQQELTDSLKLLEEAEAKMSLPLIGAD